jgi:uncharacterized protein (DUF1778 family)
MAKIRININVTPKQKDDIQKRADALGMTMTDYILFTALKTQEKNESEVVNDQQERVSDLLRYIGTLEQQLEIANQRYNDMHTMAQLMQIKALPFYKRIFTKGIENK